MVIAFAPIQQENEVIFMSIVDSLRKLSLKLTGAYSTGEDIEDNIEYIAENYSGGGGSGEPSGVLKATIVESLPDNGVEDKLYLVLSDSEEHIYNEYIWSNDVWVDLGPIHVEIDVEEITELKEDLTNIIASNNLWDLTGYIENGYIKSDGTRSTNSGWRMLYMIPVKNITTLHIQGYYADMATNTYNVTAFDSDMTYLGGAWVSASHQQYYTHEEVTLPTNTAYICIVTALNMIDKCIAYLSPWANGEIGDLTDLDTDAKNTIVSAINETKSNFDMLSNVENLWGMVDSIKTGYITSSGILSGNSGWRTLYMIPVKDEFKVFIRGYYADMGSNLYNVTAFSANKEYLGGVWKSANYQQYYELETLSLPENSAYICIATSLNMVNQAIAYLNPWSYTLGNTQKSDSFFMPFMLNKSFSAFLKFGVVGDSLSVGYTGNDDQRNIDYSWGQVIARKYGVTCANFGKSGATTKSWFTDQYCYSEIIKAENMCQAYIVGIGTNDTIDSSFPIGSSSDIDLSDSSNNADSFYGWYGKIIQTIISVNPTAKIFCFTIPYPRIDSDKNTAIRTICTLFNNVYLVDLATQYNDLFTDDNITDFAYAGHFSPGGYANLADINMYALSETIKEYADEFTEIDDIPFGVTS